MSSPRRATCLAATIIPSTGRARLQPHGRVMGSPIPIHSPAPMDSSVLTVSLVPTDSPVPYRPHPPPKEDCHSSQCRGNKCGNANSSTRLSLIQTSWRSKTTSSIFQTESNSATSDTVASGRQYNCTTPKQCRSHAVWAATATQPNSRSSTVTNKPTRWRCRVCIRFWRCSSSTSYPISLEDSF